MHKSKTIKPCVLGKNGLLSNLPFRNRLILNTSVILYMFVISTGLLIFMRANGILSDMSREAVQTQVRYLESSVATETVSYERAILLTLISDSLGDMLGQSRSGESVIDNSRSLSNFIASQSSSYVYPLNMRLYVDDAYHINVQENLDYIRSIRGEAWYAKLHEYSYNRVVWLYSAASQEEYTNGVFICAVGIPVEGTGIHAYVKMAVNANFIFSILANSAGDNADTVLVYNVASDELLWSSGRTLEKYVSNTKKLLTSGDTEYDDGDASYHAFTNSKLGIRVVYIHEAGTAALRYMGFAQYSILVLAAVILFSMVMLLFSAQFLTRRLAALTTQVQAIDEHNLRYDNNISGNDEFSKLSQAFKDLISRVNNLISRIKSIEKEKTILEVKALQDQINPHFLYNTLSVINALASEIQADNISEALNALAQFYRLSLSNGSNAILVRDELEMLRHYIKICSIRYQNNLTIDIQADEQALCCRIPTLIIQPFIENAAFHGFYTTPTECPVVTLRIHRYDEKLIITITDNGKGISKDRLEEIQKGDGGYAISNINRRLKLIYGEKYGVQIDSGVDKGTTVVIIIPAEETETI